MRHSLNYSPEAEACRFVRSDLCFWLLTDRQQNEALSMLAGGVPPMHVLGLLYASVQLGHFVASPSAQHALGRYLIACRRWRRESPK